ncbi:MAG TPA: heavy metal-binding domain-containing protein, partial [Gemmataceae bacterium]|nr:heavy metal-binding domain-containing protein [Gemmataceae bacterium]
MSDSHAHPSTHTHGLNLSAGPGGETDPVCGMTVDPATAPASVAHGGRTYYFCNPGCARKFSADPERYLHAAPSAANMEAHAPPPPPPGARVEYVCPMDPEVVSDRPGSCPKCGMALEPRTALAEEGPNPELADMSRRLWVGVALGVPLVVLDMLHRPGLGWLEWLLATPVVFWCGLPFFRRAATSVVNLSPNMFTLIALGVGAAYAYSVAALLAPTTLGQGLFFETSAVIIV